MDNLFTHNYNSITQVGDFKIQIEGRWICCIFKDQIGASGEQFTLIDNYCESYYLIFNGGEVKIDKGEICDNYLRLRPAKHFLHPLPDIGIDVIQTTSHPVGLETLSRLASVVHTRKKNKL